MRLEVEKSALSSDTAYKMNSITMTIILTSVLLIGCNKELKEFAQGHGKVKTPLDSIAPTESAKKLRVSSGHVLSRGINGQVASEMTVTPSSERFRVHNIGVEVSFGQQRIQ